MVNNDKSLYIMRDDESLDTLDEKLCILQKKNGFKFGIDAVLLADFARIYPNDRVCDLCTGGGILPLLLSRKNPKFILGVELQAEYADMAIRSVKRNSLSDMIKILEFDIKNISEYEKPESFEVVTVNPPYKEVGGGIESPVTEKNLAKNEISAKLGDVIKTAAYLLKPKGKLFMVHRTERLADIFGTMRDFGFEVKRMRLVQGSKNKPPSLVLLEAQKAAKPKLLMEPTLIVMENGEESEEIKRIYRR